MNVYVCHVRGVFLISTAFAPRRGRGLSRDLDDFCGCLVNFLEIREGVSSACESEAEGFIGAVFE